MSRTKTVTRRQSAVIEDLFTGEMKEPEILAKHGVGPREYERWLADDGFAERIERRIVHAHRQSRIVLARHAARAASRLVELMDCDKGEIARRACLDIIALHIGDGQKSPVEGGSDPGRTPVVPAHGLTPEMARRLLAALAGDRQDRHEDLRQGAGI